MGTSEGTLNVFIESFHKVTTIVVSLYYSIQSIYTHVNVYKCGYSFNIVYLQAFVPNKYRISVRSRLSRHSSHSSQVQTLPRLPPVMSSHLDKKEFSFPTLADIKHSQKLQDAVVVEHSSSNPYCRCAMCMLHKSATASVAEEGLQTAAAVTGVQQGEQQRTCRDTNLCTKLDKHF